MLDLTGFPLSRERQNRINLRFPSHSTGLQTTAAKSLVIPLGLKIAFLVRLLSRLRDNQRLAHRFLMG